MTGVPELDIREQIVRIDQMIAGMQQKHADRDRKRQEIRVETWKIVIAVISGVTSAMAAGAALFAAGAAYIKLFPNG